jgi:tetratricopeptide (TPR) repeat protein
VTARTFVVGLALLITLAMATSADLPRMNRDIALLYVDAAADAIAVAHYEEACRFLDRALEQNPLSSDAHYLSAVARAHDQTSTVQAEEHLQQALQLDSWSRYTGTHGAAALAAIYYRTGRYREVGEVLADVPADDPLLPEELLAQMRYYQIRALYESGDPGADRLLVRSRDRFPDDARFFDIALSREAVPSLRYRDELERLIAADSGDDPALLIAVLRYAETAPTAEEATWAVATYLDFGGADPAVALAQDRFTGESDLSLFVELGGVAHRDLVGAVVSSDESTLSTLEEAVSQFSGTAIVDSNRDGFYEERLTVSDGMIVSWSADRNQDGVHEVEIELGPRLPQTARVDTPAGLVQLRYGRYPYVESAEVSGAEGTERMVVRPNTVSFSVLQEIPEDGPSYGSTIRLRDPLPVVDLGAVSRASISVEDLDPEGRPVRIRYLENGAVARVVSDLDRDGRWDQLAVLRDGVVVGSVRDIDTDGYFEVAEGYTDGQLAIRAIDENDNGTPEIVEIKMDDVREWDLNEDGTIDFREFGIWTDGVKSEFSFLELNR